MSRQDFEDTSRYRPLAELPALALESGSVDVRGWPVMTAAAERVGVVQDLLVDVDHLRAEYLVVDPDRQTVAGLSPTELAVVPIASARLDRVTRQVLIAERPVADAPPAVPYIRVRYRSTNHITWMAAALAAAALGLAWLLGMFNG